jgi:triosephosphate isomerase
MRQQIIAGNWKLFGTIDETENLIRGLLDGNSQRENTLVLVFPPYPSLMRASQLLDGSHIGLGAQDMSAHESGAFTAEVSARMLLTVGAQYVILGHSERRQYHAETDQQVNAKAKLALANKLVPVICVGETREQREADQTEEVIRRQIGGTLEGIGADDLKRSVIAYEPVWAIGTGLTATPEQAEEVHQLIRGLLDSTVAEDVRILYGGSVKPGNARELLEQPDIDGALVGGASLKAEDFCGIINPR